MHQPIPFQSGDKINLSLLKKQIDRRLLKITHMVKNSSFPKQEQKKCSDKCCQLNDTFTQTQQQYFPQFIQSYKSKSSGPLKQIDNNRTSNKNKNIGFQQIPSPISYKKIIPKPMNGRGSFPKKQNKENYQNQQSLYQQLSFKKSPDRIKISMIINSLPQTYEESQMESPSMSKDFLRLNNSIQNNSILGSNQADQQFMNNRQDYEQVQEEKFFSNCAVFQQLFQKVQQIEPSCSITKNQHTTRQSGVKNKSVTKLKVSKLSASKNDLDTSTIQRLSNKRKRTNSIFQNYKNQKKSINVTQSFDKIVISNQCKQKMRQLFLLNSQKVRKQCKGNNIRVSLLRRIQQKYLKGKQRVEQY